MISTRHATGILLALLLALVPTVVHTYLGWAVDDGSRAGHVPEVLAGVSSREEPHSRNWGRRHFSSDDWIARWYGPDGRLRLSVVRTFDAKKVYHHPELAISYPDASLGRAELFRTVDGDAAFVLRGVDQSRDLVVYALLSGGRPIANPYAFQVRLAAEMLVRGQRSMTLVYVQDRMPPAVPLENQPAVSLLRQAVSSLRAGQRAAGPDPAAIR